MIVLKTPDYSSLSTVNNLEFLVLVLTRQKSLKFKSAILILVTRHQLVSTGTPPLLADSKQASNKR